MNYLADSAVAVICFVPVFLIMSLIFGALIWNNLKSRPVKKNADDNGKED